MKSTDMVRNVDHVGRVVLPVGLRRKLGIENGDPIEFSLENGRAIFQKHQPNACAITGEIRDDNISLLNGDLTLSKDGAKMLIEELNSRL